MASCDTTHDELCRLHSFDDQPAIDWVSAGVRSWWLHGKRHRVSGPAYTSIWYDGTNPLRRWYLFGIQLSRGAHHRIVTLPIRWRERRMQRRMQQFHLARKGRWVP